MTDKPTTAKMEIVSPSPTPSDASDIEALWLDPALGDGLTDTNWHTIPVDKPKDFFRVHPNSDYRRRTEIYAHKTEGQIETTYYILGPEMRGRLQEARVLRTCHLRLSRRLAARLADQVSARGRKGLHSLVERPVRGTHCNRQMGETGLGLGARI